MRARVEEIATRIGDDQEAAEKTLKDPKVIGMIEKLGGAIVDFKSGDDYKKELLADFNTFKQMVPILLEKKYTQT